MIHCLQLINGKVPKKKQTGLGICMQANLYNLALEKVPQFQLIYAGKLV